MQEAYRDWGPSLCERCRTTARDAGAGHKDRHEWPECWQIDGQNSVTSGRFWQHICRLLVW
jgi:hypothetical protein